MPPTNNLPQNPNLTFCLFPVGTFPALVSLKFSSSTPKLFPSFVYQQLNSNKTTKQKQKRFASLNLLLLLIIGFSMCPLKSSLCSLFTIYFELAFEVSNTAVCGNLGVGVLVFVRNHEVAEPLCRGSTGQDTRT
jgi:hypothetical protein